jgi:hypothetical protein
VLPNYYGGAEERVLERVLRRGLMLNRDQRVRTGHEFASRLQLALHPDAAARFEPAPSSFAGRVLTLWVIVVGVICIMLPNIAAGVFNWEYNFDEIIMKRYAEMEDDFRRLARAINWITFPFGGLLLVWFCLQVQQALRQARLGAVVSKKGLNATWHLGLRAALIGGVLWVIAGIAYPLVLRFQNPQLSFADCCHFFLSLALCGGVALIYPFFGLTCVSIGIYYPRLVSASMHDPDFPRRARSLRIRSTIYLGIAAGIPLLALALLIPLRDTKPWFLFITLGITAFGLLTSFIAYQLIAKNLADIGQVLDRSQYQPEARARDHQY